jgi:hypothetical protein
VTESAQLEFGGATAVGPTGVTAAQMVAMLRRHYLPEGRVAGGVFAPEIGSPDGKRRADLIWMPTTTAGGNGLHGHEVKVTRTDLLVELAEPAKAEPWAQYCTRWWLVVAHPALVEGLEVPAPWGVMSPPSGRRTRTMTVLKPAPELKPRDPAPGLARLAAWMLNSRDEEMVELRRRVEQAERGERVARAQYERLRVEGVREADPDVERAAKIIAMVRERTNRTRLWRNASDEDVVAAIIDASATADAAETARREIRQLMDNVDRVLAPFRSTPRDLAEAKALAARIAKP